MDVRDAAYQAQVSQTVQGLTDLAGLLGGLGLGLEARCDVLGLTTPVLLRILCQLPFFGVGEGSD